MESPHVSSEGLLDAPHTGRKLARQSSASAPGTLGAGVAALETSRHNPFLDCHGGVQKPLRCSGTSDVTELDCDPGLRSGAVPAWGTRPITRPRGGSDAVRSDDSMLEALMAQQTLHEERMAALLEAHQEQLLDSVKAVLSQRGSNRLLTTSAGSSSGQRPQSPVKSAAVLPMAPAPPKKLFVEPPPPSAQAITREWKNAWNDRDERESQTTIRSSASSTRVVTAQDVAEPWEPVVATKSAKSARSARLSTGAIQAQAWLHDMLKVTSEKAGKGTLRSAAKRIASSRFFEYAVSMLISVNALVIGAQASWTMNNLLEDDVPFIYRVFDLAFTTAFLIELFIRMVAEGMSFLSRRNRMFGWNVFDLALVGSAVFEEILNVVTTAQPNWGAARLVRLIRLARIIKAIRVMRFFRDLRVMVAGVMQSLQPLFYALVLLLLIMYISGIMIMQTVADSLAAGEGNEELLLFHFQSLPRTILTLFKAICGGVDWGDVVEPLIDISPFLGVFFALYVAFASLCVLNIITGVFVENAMQITSKDDETLVMEELANRTQRVEDVKKLFASTGGQEDGELSLENFEACFADARVQAYFKKVGLDVSADNPKAIFNLFDFDSDGKISVAEFATGLQQIHGSARAIDIVRMKHEIKVVRSQMDKLIKFSGCESEGRKLMESRSTLARLEN